MFKSLLSGAVIALLSLAVPAYAQTDIPPAFVAVLDGDVTLVRDGQPLNAIVNMPIVAGDRLTTAAGRIEVLFPDGAALDLDEGATADFGPGSPGSTDGRIRLSSGRAILVVPAGTNAARYEIDTPSGAVVTRGPGKYRADASGANAKNDGFEGWSDALRAARAAPAASPSAEHLPEELQAYDTTLDQSGTWQYAPTYGYVWYPRVESDWRPYYEGSWTSVPSYGWTWVGAHRWEYPTHHYGRWGYTSNRWFWIPGRAYAPAWVAWGYASDYVSWCPLGIDSRPVFAMTVGYGNPWTGWTVVSKSHFGGRGYVPRLAVAPHQLPVQTPFVVQHAAPSVTPRVERFAVPSSGGVGVAVPRSPARTTTPTPVAPRSSTPETVIVPQPPQTIVVPRQRPREQPSSGRPNPGDDPAYAPRYAPTYTPPTPETAAPARQTPPPAAAAPRPAPAATTPNPSTPAAAPRTAPATSPPAATPAPHSPPPAQKSGDAAKPAQSGKARGRGGL